MFEKEIDDGRIHVHLFGRVTEDGNQGDHRLRIDIYFLHEEVQTVCYCEKRFRKKNSN